MLDELLSFFYPAACFSCGTIMPPRAVVCCQACESVIKPVVSLPLALTKKHTMNVAAGCAYLDPVKELVVRKFSQDMRASRQLAAIMIAAIPKNYFEADYLIPVPLHWTRYARRGFNQSLVIARVLGKHYNIPVLNVLSRHKRTAFQSTLTHDLRHENVIDAFKLRTFFGLRCFEHLRGKRLVLVDDLCTTGSTLVSAAKVLHALKPEGINAVVACRAL